MGERLRNESLLPNGDLYNSTYGNYSGPYLFDDDQLHLAYIVSLLHVYVIPVIILVGIVGNTASFLVFIGTPRLCRQSSSMYLAFLAAVDNLLMITVFVVWLGWVGIRIFMKNGWCQTIMYCIDVCSFLSVWTVVSFTCERWIVVFHPLKRHHLCTRRRAIIVMTSLTIGALVFYSYSIFTSSVTSKDGISVCATLSKYHSAIQVLSGINTIVTVLIPLAAIIVMNTGIGIRTCRYANRKKALEVPVDSVDDISGFTSVNRQSETRNGHASVMSFVSASGRLTINQNGSRSWRLLTRRRHTQLRITQALLVVSSVFVLLNLPCFVFHIHAFIISIRHEALEKVVKSQLIQELIQFFYYINFASRFFLHAASSRTFRYALKRLITRLKHRLAKIFYSTSAGPIATVVRDRH